MSNLHKFQNYQVTKPDQWLNNGKFAIIVFKSISARKLDEIYVFSEESTWKEAITEIMTDKGIKNNFIALRNGLPATIKTHLQID